MPISFGIDTETTLVVAMRGEFAVDCTPGTLSPDWMAGRLFAAGLKEGIFPSWRADYSGGSSPPATQSKKKGPRQEGLSC